MKALLQGKFYTPLRESSLGFVTLYFELKARICVWSSISGSTSSSQAHNFPCLKSVFLIVFSQRVEGFEYYILPIIKHNIRRKFNRQNHSPMESMKSSWVFSIETRIEKRRVEICGWVSWFSCLIHEKIRTHHCEHAKRRQHRRKGP